MKVEVYAGLTLLVGLALGTVAYQGGAALSGVGGESIRTAAAPISGQTLYSANCAGCHGETARGAVGAKLAGVINGWSVAGFAAAVLDGRAPGGRALAPMMPHFRSAGFDGAQPTRPQLAAVFTYIRGLPSGE